MKKLKKERRRARRSQRKVAPTMETSDVHQPTETMDVQQTDGQEINSSRVVGGNGRRLKVPPPHCKVAHDIDVVGAGTDSGNRYQVLSTDNFEPLLLALLAEQQCEVHFTAAEREPASCQMDDGEDGMLDVSIAGAGRGQKRKKSPSAQGRQQEKRKKRKDREVMSPSGLGSEVPGCSTSVEPSTAAVEEEQKEKENSEVTSPHQLPSGSGSEYSGSRLPTKHTVQNDNDDVPCCVLPYSVNSPHVSRESADFAGHAGRSRSPSPLFTDDDDSVHDEDFDYQAAVELEARQRRRYGPSSDSEDGEVASAPPRKQRYRQLPPLKAGASAPAPVEKAWNAGRPRKCSSTWRPSKICPVPECGYPNTHPRRHLERCHKDLPASEVARFLALLRRRKVNVQPTTDDDQPTTEDTQTTAPVDDVQDSGTRKRYVCTLCGVDVLRLDTHLQRRHSLRSDSDDYQRARDDSKVLDPAAKTGPVADLDTIMDGFYRFLMSMPGGDKKETVARTIQRDVRRITEDLLAGEPYTPRCLVRLQTIGDVPTGLLHRYSLGELRGGIKYKSTTLAVYVSSLQHFHSFLRREPQYLRGGLDDKAMEKLSVVLKGCLTSLHKRRLEEDAVKRIMSIGSYCSPSVLGRFLCSDTFEHAMSEIATCERSAERCTTGAFVAIRNVLMLAAGIMNARRTGDLCNMTLEEFDRARPSRARPADHIVHVLRHKTAASKPCKVNFYNRLYTLTCRYVRLFRDVYLQGAAPDGRVFPSVGTGNRPGPMTPSLFNKAIKRVWASFLKEDKRPDNPPASALTSSYLRHVFVSAVHSNASRDQMAETAAHMSHTLTTAETHYEAHGALELTSRACKLFRQHLCVDNPELNDATGLLCSSDDDDVDDVEQNVSSPDASSEDDVSDVEDIDDQPDCPVTSGVPYEDGVARPPGRSSPRLVESQPVRADVPVASGSGTGPSVRVRGNQCLDAEDVRLLASATSDYRSTLVTSYAPITAERVISLLRAEGGPFADLVDRFQARVNGRRCLADRVRTMVQAERRRRGLPPNKGKVAGFGQSVGPPDT